MDLKMIAGTNATPGFYKNWLHILNKLNIGAFTVDLKRNITAINDCAQGLLGFRETEILGRCALYGNMSVSKRQTS
jgi:sensor histidine kinase regulating citrate/malate metabolism